MNNVLPLFTTLENLDFEITDETDEGTTKEAKYTSKDGTKISLIIVQDEENKSYVITGGFMFKAYDTEKEFIQMFYDIQKGKVDLFA